MNTDYPHKTVLLQEAVNSLNIQSDGSYVDATFGRGGHSREILQRLGKNGRLLVIDQDTEAIKVAEQLAKIDQRVLVVHDSFSNLVECCSCNDFVKIDGIVLDLGVSSPQLDDAKRGFSFRFDAELDMRMDTTRGETAAEWLARATEYEIADILRRYSDERYAFRIAKKITKTRGEQSIKRTHQLAELVRSCVPTRESGQDAATRSFQAIRIHINQELQALELALKASLELLVNGGRLAVISFHSLEDRIVKQFIKNQVNPDIFPRDLPLRHDQLPRARLKEIGKAIYASKTEISANPRARSAVLRVAERI